MNLSYWHNRKFGGERKNFDPATFRGHFRDTRDTAWPGRDKFMTNSHIELRSFIVYCPGRGRGSGGRSSDPSPPAPKWRHIHKKDPPESLMKPLTVSEGVVKFSLWSSLSLGPSQLQHSGMSNSGLLCHKSSKSWRCCNVKKKVTDINIMQYIYVAPSPGQEKEVGVGRGGKESAPVLSWTVSVSLYIIYRQSSGPGCMKWRLDPDTLLHINGVKSCVNQA